MFPHHQTQRAMRLSRGLVLGRVWTAVRHFVIGGCTITLAMLAATGHFGVAIGIVVGWYLLCRGAEGLSALRSRRAH